MITVPFGVGIAIAILGVIIYIVEWGQKAHKHMERKQAGQQLARDLSAPKPSAQLPYGLSGSDGTTAAAKPAMPAAPEHPADR
jgi:hypothetical protein